MGDKSCHRWKEKSPRHASLRRRPSENTRFRGQSGHGPQQPDRQDRNHGAHPSPLAEEPSPRSPAFAAIDALPCDSGVNTLQAEDSRLSFPCLHKEENRYTYTSRLLQGQEDLFPRHLHCWPLGTGPPKSALSLKGLLAGLDTCPRRRRHQRQIDLSLITLRRSEAAPAGAFTLHRTVHKTGSKSWGWMLLATWGCPCSTVDPAVHTFASCSLA